MRIAESAGTRPDTAFDIANPVSLVVSNRSLGAKPALVYQQTNDQGLDASNVSDVVVTYAELGRVVEEYREGLQRCGLGSGDRIVLLVPLGLDAFGFVIAAACEAAVPVLLDPAMGPNAMRRALGAAGPRAIVSVRRALRLTPLVPELRAIPLRFCVEGQGRGLRPLAELRAGDASSTGDPLAIADDALAMLAFTTGSTGNPKGVARTPRNLVATYKGLCAELQPPDDEVVLSAFPAFALYVLAAGRTVVCPPSSADPAAVMDLATRQGVTSLGMPPASLASLLDHSQASGARIPTLRRVWTGGAPVPTPLVARARELWPDVTGQVLYGSTEAEPIAAVTFDEILASDGAGVLVGRERAPTSVAVVPIGGAPDDPSASTLPPHETGEILVAGPQVVETYWRNEEATRELKLRDASRRVWHRTGDTGYRDSDGRLWLTGRVADLIPQPRGKPLQPLPIEHQLDALVGVRRSALIAHERAPYGEVLIECEPDNVTEQVLARVRTRLLDANLDLPVVPVATVALDRRHRSKIDRPSLRLTRRHPWGTQAAGAVRDLISRARAVAASHRTWKIASKHEGGAPR